MKEPIFEGANWLRGMGTFRVKCSRERKTAYVTVSQKGGISIL